MLKEQHTDKILGFFLRPFSLLDDYLSRLFLVAFCGIFATFFINFYEPLNIRTWHHDSTLGNFLTIWSAGILGAILLSITQLVLRPIFKLNTFNNGQFLLWVLFEFFLLTILMFVLYGESKIPFLEEFFLVFRYTISLTIIPYFLACLLIAVIKLSNNAAKESLVQKVSLAQHSFKDENGKVMLAIKPTQLLLLKSENNYISIFYLQNEKVEKKLIRTNFKKLENELTPFPYLLRIHRSYMINLEKIASMHRKKGSFHVQLIQLPEMWLKVSETYKTTFEAALE